ncbi:MAG: hypothetical protein HY360_05830 [Verrucomicrobia bacterium]|nr:hypothetical protein [Verrucomicrobiota bacterium]
MDLLQDRSAEKVRARRRRAALCRVKAQWARVAKIVHAAPWVHFRVHFSDDGESRLVATMDDVASLRQQFVLAHYSHGSWSKHGSDNPRKNHWCGTRKDCLTRQERVADLRWGDPD